MLSGWLDNQAHTGSKWGREEEEKEGMKMGEG